MEKNLEYYMKLPYTIEMHQNPEDGWFVRVRELRGCMSHGDTAEEAAAMIREALELWLEVSLQRGLPIPEPRSGDDYSGKFVVRVPRSLHRHLVGAAADEGVSLNQLVNVLLAQGLGYPEPPAPPARTAPHRHLPDLSPVPDPYSVAPHEPAPMVLQEKPSPYPSTTAEGDAEEAQAQRDTLSLPTPHAKS
jgi:antitoxin HicB